MPVLSTAFARHHRSPAPCFAVGELEVWARKYAHNDMQILMKLLGSAIGPSIGAAVGIALMRLGGWTDWRACGLMIALFVIPVWLWVLLPLYILLPGSSPLWRPITCTGLGGISGAILMTVFFVLSRDAPSELVALYLPFAVMIGSVTCFVGALTARFFHGTKTA